MRYLLFLLVLVTPTWAVEVTQLYFPSLTGSRNLNTNGNTLKCARWIATADRTGATRLTVEVTSTNFGNDVGFALYVDSDSGAKLVGGSAFVASPPTGVTATASSFNIVAGTRYRLCVCADDNTNFDGVFVDNNASAEMKINAFLNAGLAGVVAGTAANSCTGSAVTPSTTGALTAADFAPPMGVIE